MAKRSSTKKPNAAPAGPTLPEASERILGLAVNTLGRCIVWSLAQRTAPHGVLPGAYPVIAWLMHLEKATQTELSRLIGVEQPTMTITLRRFSAYWSHVTSSTPGAARFLQVEEGPPQAVGADMVQERREAFLPVPGNGLAHAV